MARRSRESGGRLAAELFLQPPMFDAQLRARCEGAAERSDITRQPEPISRFERSINADATILGHNHAFDHIDSRFCACAEHDEIGGKNFAGFEDGTGGFITFSEDFDNGSVEQHFGARVAMDSDQGISDFGAKNLAKGFASGVTIVTDLFWAAKNCCRLHADKTAADDDNFFGNGCCALEENAVGFGAK